MNHQQVIWRPISRHDLADLHALIQQWETELDYPYRTSREELEHEMDEPDTDLERDTRVAVNDDGELVSSAWVTVRSRPGSEHQAVVLTTALQKSAHLELEALRWAEKVALRRFASLDDELPRVLKGYAESTSLARIERYESRGFEAARYFVDMARPVTGETHVSTVPDGVEIMGWDDRWARSTFEVRVEAFDDHWGTTPPTWDEFRHELAWPGVRLDLSSVAVANGEVVSFCLNAEYTQDHSLRNRREGWIGTLGTRRAWRKRGLASALIADSIARFAADGLDYALIGVDAANATGAFGLYERLGFVEWNRSVALVKQVE